MQKLKTCMFFQTQHLVHPSHVDLGCSSSLRLTEFWLKSVDEVNKTLGFLRMLEHKEILIQTFHLREEGIEEYRISDYPKHTQCFS